MKNEDERVSKPEGQTPSSRPAPSIAIDRVIAPPAEDGSPGATRQGNVERALASANKLVKRLGALLEKVAPYPAQGG